jgi:hypothetical protein
MPHNGLHRAETVTDALQPLRLGATEDAIIEHLKCDALVRELILRIFMSVQAQLGIEWKAGAELEKEGAEIAVHRIDVVVVHHRGRANDPRNAG